MRRLVEAAHTHYRTHEISLTHTKAHTGTHGCKSFTITHIGGIEVAALTFRFRVSPFVKEIRRWQLKVEERRMARRR